MPRSVRLAKSKDLLLLLVKSASAKMLGCPILRLLPGEGWDSTPLHGALCSQLIQEPGAHDGSHPERPERSDGSRRTCIFEWGPAFAFRDLHPAQKNGCPMSRFWDMGSHGLRSASFNAARKWVPHPGFA